MHFYSIFVNIDQMRVLYHVVVNGAQPQPPAKHQVLPLVRSSDHPQIHSIIIFLYALKSVIT